MIFASLFSWLYHFYGLFTTYLLYEEVMPVRLYAKKEHHTGGKLGDNI